jgi:hypothetical protein
VAFAKGAGDETVVAMWAFNPSAIAIRAAFVAGYIAVDRFGVAVAIFAVTGLLIR